MWDVHLGEEADTALVDAVAHPVDGEHRLLLHLPLPQKAVLDKDLLLLDADDDVICEDRHAAGVRVLLAGAPTITPVHPDNIYDNSRRMRGRRRILGGRLLLRRCCLPRQLAWLWTTAAEAGTGDARCFTHKAAPHILHSTAAHLFLV